MQNIQDLKEKIFFESKNIIDILEKIHNVDELLSKQDLVDELANRISFLRLLEKNIEYFVPSTALQNTEYQNATSSVNTHEYESDSSHSHEVTEEEAIFNNELNEIDDHETLEEEVFEIPENKEEAYNNQLTETAENSHYYDPVEESVQNLEVQGVDGIEKEDAEAIIEEEVIFTNQLNEINEFENEISDDQEDRIGSFDEEENIQKNIEGEIKAEEKVFTGNVEETVDANESIPNIFDNETLEDEILIEENEAQFISSNVSIEESKEVQEESNSNIDHIIEDVNTEDKRKIVEIDRGQQNTEKEKHPSDESFENLEAYHQEKKIKLANIKGLKTIQSLFDDDPLAREGSHQMSESALKKEDDGSLLKTNIPTNFMEAEKPKPEFRLDLNDRIAFSKMLFGGSQTELNDVISELNSFKTLEEAKEYLSDLYYSKNWKKADEYAQRLWVLIENKFL